MYIPSNNYKIASKKVCRVPKSKIIIDGVEYTGIKYVKDHPKIIHNSTKIIGEFTTKECSISIFNRDNNLDLVGKDIEVYRGLIVSDKIIEYVPQGVFEVKADSIKTNSTARTLELSIKDKSTVFDCLYGGEGNISYPCTLGEFVNEIITRHDLILETPDFPFSDFVLEQQPNFDINSSTERELIAQAGELGGCKVQMSRTGGVKISKPYATGITIERIDYKKLPSKEKQFGPINSVVLSRKNQTNNDIAFKDKESIATNGLCEWKIYDNPYVDLIREEVIEAVASNIIGMSIVPFELNDAIDSYCYDINDSINITDKEGNVFSSTILSIKSTSRIFTDLSAPVQIENKTNYKLAGSSKNKIEKIALDVDYNKKRIDAVVQTQEDLSGEIVDLGTKYSQTQKDFQFQISGLEETINSNNQNLQSEIDNINGSLTNGVETLKNSLVTININGIQVSTNLSKVSTLITNDSFKIIPVNNPDEPLAFFGYDEKEGRSKSEMDNLTVKNYFTVGYHRQEEFKPNGEKRTGWFYVGGNI